MTGVVSFGCFGLVLRLGGELLATARFHQGDCWLRSLLAARGMGAAIGGAGRNIDSKILSLRFDYCAPALLRGVLQQYRHFSDLARISDLSP
jgi:hypothetical protein